MSWDVLLINSKAPVNIDSEDTPDFPSRTDFIKKVTQIFRQQIGQIPLLEFWIVTGQ
jgi:hypothetical protein